MKNKKQIVLLFLLLISVRFLHAQIQFDHSFSFSTALTELEEEGEKFFLMDVENEQVRLYSKDYSLWKTIQLNVPNGFFLGDVQFASQSLFNSDNQVEFLVMYYKYIETQTSYYYDYTTEIVNQNGSVLLSVPGGAYYSVSADKEGGSKLLIYVYDYSVWPYTVETRIYSVPGQLTGIPSEENNLFSDQITFNAYPNPGNGQFTLKTGHGRIPIDSKLIVRDVAGRIVHHEKLNWTSPEYQLHLIGLDSGTYFYEIETPYLKLKPQKLIIAR